MSLIRWETNIKKNIEEKTFQDRGKADYDRYVREELEYNNTNYDIGQLNIKTI